MGRNVGVVNNEALRTLIPKEQLDNFNFLACPLSRVAGVLAGHPMKKIRTSQLPPCQPARLAPDAGQAGEPARAQAHVQARWYDEGPTASFPSIP